MQILEGELLESRWSPCVRRSWAHPCCLLTSSQLGGLNPHARIGSPQALWACWTPNSRFNLPSNFAFINHHLFSTLPKDSHCDSLLFFFFFFCLRTGLLDFCCFVSLLYFPLFRLFSPCSHGLSAESISIKCSPANTRVRLWAQPPCWQSENVASLHPICFSKVTRRKITADSSPWFND